MLDTVMGGDTPAKRLQAARKKAGFESVLQFCREFNLKPPTVYAHESGHRQIDAATAALYARMFKINPAALLYGTQLSSARPIPIVAMVGAGGKISMLNDRVEVTSTVTLQSVDDLVGLLVCGDDLYPAYRDGDVVFHRRLDPQAFDPLGCHGRDCVVQLGSGDTLLRIVTMQSNGRATLMSYKSAPMFDQEIIAAEPVEIVQRQPPDRPVGGIVRTTTKA